MILVLLGGKSEKRKQIIAQIIESSPRERRISHENLSSNASDEARLAQIQRMWPQRDNSRNVVIVTLVRNDEELRYLRKIGAFVCHVYGGWGACGEVYKRIAINANDGQVALDTGREYPAHVCYPAEILEKCVRHHAAFVR